MSRLISIVGINEKKRIWEMQNPHDPFNGWQQTPGAHHDPFNKWPQTQPGAHLGPKGPVYDQREPEKKWVNDPPIYASSVPSKPYQAPARDRFNWLSFFMKWIIRGIIFLVVIALIMIIVVPAFQRYLKNINGAYDSVQKGITSTWSGDELQYNRDGYTGTGHTDMIVTIDSIKKGSLHGQVYWPRMDDTITKAEGTIVANVKHKDIHWKYVDTCSSKGIYLQFTETEYIQGNSVLLNVKYYAVVCNGTLGGVWFWPDRPNDAPGGEFSLPWKSP